MIATRTGHHHRDAEHYLEFLRRERDRSDAVGGWFRRAGAVDTASASDADRSVMATIATEQPVQTYDRRDGRIYDEVLVMRGAQLPDWAPLLDSHQTYSLMHVLGSVRETTRSGRVCRGRFVFARDDDYVDPIYARVRDGHIRGVSVGGRRLSWVDIEPGETATVVGRRWTAGRQRPLRITTRWVMREASIVIFGADTSATTI